MHCVASMSELLVHHWCCTRQYGSYVCTACLHMHNEENLRFVQNYASAVLVEHPMALHFVNLSHHCSAISSARRALRCSFLCHSLSSPKLRCFQGSYGSVRPSIHVQYKCKTILNERIWNRTFNYESVKVCTCC